MNSVVLLLAILTTTFILSKLNIIRQIQGLLVVPIVIATGYLFGPFGLFTLDKSFTLTLDTSIRVILVWLGFLAGLRVLTKDREYSWRRQGLRRGLYIVLSTALIFVVFQWIFETSLFINPLAAIGLSLCLASIFVTSSYFSQAGLELEDSLTFFSYADNLFLTASFLAGAVLFVPPEEQTIFLSLHLLVPFLVGLVALFLFGKKKELETPDRLVLGGIVTLAAGWSLGVSALEVIVGFLLGVMVSGFRLVPRFDPRLLGTEVPLRLVIYFYAGLAVTLTWEAILVASVLTTVRFACKWWLVRRHSKRMDRLSSVYRLSSLSIPLVLSLHLSSYDLAVAPFLLTVLCLAYLFNDLLLIVEFTIFRTSRTVTQPPQSKELTP